jgi:hypothetical protein
MDDQLYRNRPKFSEKFVLVLAVAAAMVCLVAAVALMSVV